MKITPEIKSVLAPHRKHSVADSPERKGNGHDKRPRFRLQPFNSINVSTDPIYLVKGIVPAGGLVVAWGPPKCGKSFWTFDLMMHVALGREYRARRVRQGPVIYLALEGGKGFQARVQAFRQRFVSVDEPVPFFLIADTLNLIKDQGELIGCIRDEAKDSWPAAVVIDTLNRSLAGSESDDKDMSAYIRAADAIREAFGCVVIIVHHCGIDATRPRGHTSLTGAVDAQLAVKRDAADNVLVTVEWMKDGPEGDVIASRLEPVEVGVDADGDPITSCVIAPVDPLTIRAAPSRKLSDRQKLALDALADCAADRGIAPPATFGLPGGLLAVPLNIWRQELFAKGVLDLEAKSPREDFRRVKNSLQARKLIGVRDDLIWRAM